METLLSRWLGVRPEERKRTALLFSYLFLATLFVILGRTARDTLFLSRASIADLPWMYVGIALATGLMAGLYSRLVSGAVGLYALLQSTLLLVVAFLLVVRGLIHYEIQWAFSVFYIGMEVAGSLIVLQFWTFVNESFNSREAKRLFGVIGSGGILGAIFGGLAGSLLVERLSVADLLIVCAWALIACSTIAAAAKRSVGQLDSQGPGRPLPTSGGILDGLTHSRYTLLLTGMALLLTLAVSFIDYNFKVVAQGRYEEAELAQIFARLYGFCGLLSFVFHFFFTGRILMRLGLLIPLVALPLSLSLGAVGLIVWPFAFFPLLITKGADVTLRYSLYDSVNQLLYIPLPVPLRRRLKAAIDGVVKPLGVALAGLLFLVLPPLTSPQLGVLLIGLLGAWLLAAVNVRQGYTRALMNTLRQGLAPISGDATLNDVASVRALVEALRHGEEEAVCAALELLPPERRSLWATHVIPLLGAPRPRVRLAALQYIERESIEVPLGRFEALLCDPDEDVRAAAVGWFGSSEASGVGERLLGFLRDPGPQVRARAAVELLRRDGDGALHGARCLEAMSESHDPQARHYAAIAIGQAPIPGGEERLLTLLGDEESLVQRGAVAAAGNLGTPLLRAALLGLLGSRTGAEAAVALAKGGLEVLPSLVDGLARAQVDEVYRLHLLQAMGEIGGNPVIEALVGNLPDDPEVRSDLLQGAVAILRSQETTGVSRELVGAALLRELETCVPRWTALVDLGQGEELMLLREALVEELVQARRRVFLILALVYPSRELMTLSRAVESQESTLMANAAEVLDDTLDWEFRPLVLPLVDDATPGEILHRLEGRVEVHHSSPEACLGALMSPDHDRWVRACALFTAGRLGYLGLSSNLLEILESDPDPILRETALGALVHSLNPREGRAIAERFLDDDCPLVKSLATDHLGGASL